MQSATPKVLLPLVWPVSLSLAATQKISFDFSSSPYLDVSVQAVFLRIPMYSVYDDRRWIRPGSPIQKSTGRRLFAPIRGLSQLITSFFGSWCQGILHVLFLTWPLCFKSFFSLELLQNYMSKCYFFPFFEIVCILTFVRLPVFLKIFKDNIFTRFFALFSWQSSLKTSLLDVRGGDEENRTPDPLLARQVLSQLSYTPTWCFLY